jgi:hypothetical protein
MNVETPTTCCPPARAEGEFGPLEGPQAEAELATLAKAIAHPVRVEILRILLRKNTCICGAIVDYCIEPLTLRRLKDLVGAL